MTRVELIAELGRRAARHKLVPFLGSGCTFKATGFLWKDVIQHLEEAAGERLTGTPPEQAQQFCLIRGRRDLETILVRLLRVDVLRAEHVSAVLALLSINPGLIYTTNQDTVIEQLAQRFGRRLRTVRRLEDLSDYLPGERVVMKYHGCVEQPETIVFTRSDYDVRIADRRHFLNIRLQADALAKSFLFLGYSFSDPNVQVLFQELNEVFAGKLPPSWLVAYHYTRDLDDFLRRYGVTVIDPVSLYPETEGNHDAAFERFLGDLAREAINEKRSDEIRALFEPAVPPPIPVLLHYELSALEAHDVEADLAAFVSRFRGYLDAVKISDEHEERVSKLYVRMCRACRDAGIAQQLHGSFANLHLRNTQFLLSAWGAAIAAASLIPAREPIDVLRVHTWNHNEELHLFAVGVALEFMESWNWDVDDVFRNRITNWVDYSANYESYPDDAKRYVQARIDWAWRKRTTYEHPLRRRARIGKLRTHTVDDFMRSMEGHFPRRVVKPPED